MGHFYLRVKPSLETPKLVISISKKVSKKAVVRNRIRRRVRPIARKLVADLKPATYFIVAKIGAEEVRGKELEEELAALLKKR